MEENKHTKEKIREEALNLFAVYGYKAVSIRDICKKVGIKESSLYYHYKNKQALFEAILEKVNEIMQEMENQFTDVFSTIESVEEEAFCQVAVGFLENYYLSSYIYKVIRVLSIERLSDDYAASMYQKWVFDLPLEKQTKVFEEMAEKKWIGHHKPNVLAYMYHAMIYLAFEKNCLGVECTEENIVQAKEEVKQCALDFFRSMR